MFSHAVNLLKNAASTLTLFIMFLIIASSFPISFPKIFILPSSGTSNVLIILIKVDLPQPLGPRTPKISPSLMLKETPTTALNLSLFSIFLKENFWSESSNCFETFLTIKAYFMKQFLRIEFIYFLLHFLLYFWLY